MALQRVLLNGAPGQEFSTVTNGKRVVFKFRYNSLTERYWFDLSINDAPAIQGRTLVANADLFDAYPGVKSIVGKLFCVDIDNRGREPTIENLTSGDVRVFLETAS